MIFVFSDVKMGDVVRLAEWLSAASDRDVIMFCREKVPMYRHANNAWSWIDFSGILPTVSRPDKIPDIGILLHNLCVVDIDNEALVKEFENRFPILQSVPAEKTKKGMHYYFLRSQVADQYGYFDSRSAVTSGIDFKSRCANGTRGFVVCAPSKNKTWRLAPWDTHGLIPIPDDLLNAVAKPTVCTHLSADLVFKNGDVLELRNDPWLSKLELFGNLLANDDGGDHITTVRDDGVGVVHKIPIVTIDFDKAMFEDLFHILNHRIPKRIFRSLDEIKKIEELARYVGVPPEMHAKLLAMDKAPNNVFAAMKDICTYDETLARLVFRDHTTTVPPLVDLTKQDVVDGIVYQKPPASLDSKFLMPHFQSRARCNIKECDRVLYQDKSFKNLAEKSWHMMPVCVQEMMIMYHEILGVTGGSVVSSVSPHVRFTRESDYDLVLFGVDQETANRVAWDLIHYPGAQVSAITGNALTVMISETGEEVGDDVVKVQLLLRIYDTMQDLFDGFDIDACKICLTVDRDGEYQLRAAPEWVVAMRHMTVWLDINKWSKSSVYRIYKYYVKGFDIFIPGLQRQAFVRMNAFMSWASTSSTRPGIYNIFAIEWYLTKKYAPYVRATGWPTPGYTTVLKAIKLVCYKGYNARSNYDNDLLMYTPTTMMYALKEIIQKGWTWVLGGGHNVSHVVNRNKIRISSLQDVTDVAGLKNIIVWSWSRHRATTHRSRPPISPRLPYLYDFDKYSLCF
jgi:hypothetical protein